ncbi:hypothetical protein E2C01_094051 [Portunus trituberculatus]|uniref:Uncharacterized protein n=1 Tax=Portunus trituberculatus TaxID=210409 RepID=A0A5B7JKQ1_PORTR|nr:hypothetical protein [Portunus trituberculatus]
MPRIKIKQPDPSGQSKIKLLRTQSEQLIYATRNIQNSDSFIVLTRSDEDTDKSFSSTTIDILKAEQLSLVLHPEVRVKRTIVLLNLHEHIYSKPENVII